MIISLIFVAVAIASTVIVLFLILGGRKIIQGAKEESQLIDEMNEAVPNSVNLYDAVTMEVGDVMENGLPIVDVENGAPVLIGQPKKK